MDHKLFQDDMKAELKRLGGENFLVMFSELWEAHKKESDERHLDNQHRLTIIEETQAETNALIKELATVLKFWKEGKEGWKWVGRFGRVLFVIRKIILWGLSAYATYVIWRNGGQIK